MGLAIGVGLGALGLVHSPLLIAIMFSATGLGIVIAVIAVVVAVTRLGHVMRVMDTSFACRTQRRGLACARRSSS